MEYTRKPAWKMKELTLQVEVDALGCCIVDGACSQSECLDTLTQRVYELIDVDEVSGWV